MAGAFGDLGCFSFFANKNLTTGEGGMVVTNNDEFAEKIMRIRSHGMTTLTWDRHKGHAYSYDVVEPGFNYRIDEIRSALGMVQLRNLDANNAARKSRTDRYRTLLQDVPGISIPFESAPGKSAHHLFPILLGEGLDRRGFMDGMKEKGIQTSIHYPAVHLFSLYRRRFGHAEGMLPVAESIASREVTLPMFPTLPMESIQTVADAARAVLPQCREST